MHESSSNTGWCPSLGCSGTSWRHQYQQALDHQMSLSHHLINLKCINTQLRQLETPWKLRCQVCFFGSPPIFLIFLRPRHNIFEACFDNGPGLVLELKYNNFLMAITRSWAVGRDSWDPYLSNENVSNKQSTDREPPLTFSKILKKLSFLGRGAGHLNGFFWYFLDKATMNNRLRLWGT